MPTLSRLVRALRPRFALLTCALVALFAPVHRAHAQWPPTASATPKAVTATIVGGNNWDGTKNGSVTFLVATNPTYSLYDLMYSLDCGPFMAPGYWAYSYHYYWVPPYCVFDGPAEVTGSGPIVKITVPIVMMSSALSGDITLSVWPKSNPAAVQQGTAHVSWTPPNTLSASFAGVAPVKISPPNGSVVDSTFTLSVDWCEPLYNWAPTRDVQFMGQHLWDSYVDYGPTLDCSDAGTSTWTGLRIAPFQQTVTATLTNQSNVVVGNQSVALNYYPPVSQFQPSVAPGGLTRYVHAASPTAQEFKISNTGVWPATYQLSPDCGSMSGCSVDRSSITIAPGATDSVGVRFTSPAPALSKSTVSVTATYYEPSGQSIAAAATDTIRTPTIDGGNARSLFQPRVLPPNPDLVTLPPSYLTSVLFSVTNLGTAPATYHLRYTTSSVGFVPWEWPDTLITVAPGQKVIPLVIPRGPAVEGQVGSITMVATSSDTTWGTVADSAVAYMLAQTPDISFAVTPVGSHNQNVWTGAGGREVSFAITNNGNVGASGAASLSCSGFIANCRFESGFVPSSYSFSLDAGASAYPLIAYDYVGGDSSGTMRLNVNPGTPTRAADSIVFHYDGRYTAVAVTPALQVLPVRPWQSNVRQTFRITNTGTDTSAFNWSAKCAGGGVYCTAISGVTPVLVPNQKFDTTVTYGTYANGSAGSVRFTATAVKNSAATATGVDSVVVAQGAAIAVQTSAVNPGASIRRAACLSIAAGDDAAYECGDLRIVHDLPTTTTMNRARTPTLVYQSAAASMQITIAADVRVAPGTNPTTLRSTVVISNAATSVRVQRDTVVRSNWSDNRPRRIGVTFSAAEKSLPEGSYTYTYEVVALPDTTQRATDTGTLVVVDRSNSPFGRGWWLDGLEHLSVNTADPSQRLWIGGDGSTQLFVAAGPNQWTTATLLDRVETLQLLGDNTYVRWLGDSVHVHYDVYGRQIATVNRRGDSTSFDYNGDGTLRAISLPAPPGASRPSYRFTYGDYYAGRPVLTRVDAPSANGNIRAAILQHLSLTNLVASITDADNTIVRFSPDAATGLVTTRWNRLGDATTYQFDEARKLQRVTIDMSRSGESNIVTTICAAESRPVATCPRAIEPNGVYTLLDGPRTDVGDTTRFYLNRFWAPDTIVNADGYATTIVRDARFALLPASITRPNGFQSRATYNTRGLVATVTDVAPYGGLDATTTYTWNPTWDAPDKVVTPTGDSTRFGYYPNGDRQWQEDGRGPTTRAYFYYNASRQLEYVQPPGQATRYRYEYDPDRGNLKRETTPLGIVTSYHTDDIGRVDTVYSPINGTDVRTTSYSYDLADRVRIQQDHGPASSYNLGGLVSGTTGTVTLSVQNDYSNEGDLLYNTRSAQPDLTHVGALTLGWTYDPAHRKLTATDVAGRQDRWAYDEAGNETSWTTRRDDEIKSKYDELNRRVVRITPPVTRASEVGSKPVEDPNTAPRFPFFGANHYVFDPFATILTTPPKLFISKDSARFTYDNVGNLTRAENGDALVAREYYPNGAIRHDTLKIAVYDTLETPTYDRFSRHLYTLDYRYDLSGRRLNRTDHVPSCSACVQAYQYDPQSGLLSETDDGGSRFTFQYDPAARVIARAVNDPAVVDRFHYDDDGRLDHRSVRRTGAPQGIYDDQLSYDDAGRIVETAIASDYSLIADHSMQAYNGLGALVAMTRERGGGSMIDEFTPDAFGNTFEHHIWNAGVRKTTTADLPVGALATLADVPPAWSAGDPPPPPELQTIDTVSNSYDHAGNLTGSLTAVRNWTSNGLWQWSMTGPEWSWDVYDAAGQLRVVQRDMHDGTGLRTVFMEYRYDALGRRIMSRTRWDPRCVPGGAKCLSSIDRFVWDGDQILYEMRSTVSPTATGEALEAAANNGAFTGSIRYTHAGGIDEPLAIWSSNVGGIVPHRSWRGLYESGSSVDGSVRDGIAWPARDLDAFYAKDARITPQTPTNWLGSLVEGKSDPSGLMYMRNRYYDPRAGRFTQQDPIGIAGGANLYGFAGGDPVNYSDPFGLCAGPKDILCDDSAAPPGMLGTLLGGLATTGVAHWLSGVRDRIEHPQEVLAAVIGSFANEGGLEGDFNIFDWEGYPGAVRPEGPFRLLHGREYIEARNAANSANRAIHKGNPELSGLHIHENKPVKFGGNPTDPRNKAVLSPEDHAAITTWWNRLLNSLTKPGGQE